MSYEPRAETRRDRDVIVTPPPGPNYGGVAIAALVAIIAIVLAVWMFADNEGTTGDTTSPTETTVETTLPDTTLPGDETAPTIAP